MSQWFGQLKWSLYDVDGTIEVQSEDLLHIQYQWLGKIEKYVGFVWFCLCK